VFVTCGAPAGADALADVVIDLRTGPEVIAGSTRLKAGTATKVVLNAISTTAFVLLGKTYAGLMVDVRPTNAKLWARAVRIVRLLTGLDEAAALALIEKGGGRAKVAIVMHHARVGAARARELLIEHKGSLRAIIGDVSPAGIALP
jgi:N-acetylmuramic acid 6-phosphate etherase